MLKQALPDSASGKPIEIWFQDETRVGQQGGLTRVWAKRGSRPRVLKDQRFSWAYLFGAVCPARNTGAAVIMPHVNIEAMEEHLAEISRRVTEGAHAVILLDRAGWHQSRKLRLPENTSLLPLPPYSPELNPPENVWQYLRQNEWSNRVYESYRDILKACCDGWNNLMAQPDRLASIIRREWAEIKL